MEVCRGSFAFRTDETCPENIPSAGWMYALEGNVETMRWPLTTLEMPLVSLLNCSISSTKLVDCGNWTCAQYVKKNETIG